MTWKKSLATAMGLLALTVASVPCAKGETELEKLFAAPLADGEAAYMFLAFSGVIVRTTAGTVVSGFTSLLIKAVSRRFRRSPQISRAFTLSQSPKSSFKAYSIP